MKTINGQIKTLIYFLMLICFALVALMITGCNKYKQPKEIDLKTLSLHRDIQSLEMTIQASSPTTIYISYVVNINLAVKNEQYIKDTKTIIFTHPDIDAKSFIIVKWNDTRGTNEMWVL